MSRIGKKAITLPEKTEVTISGDLVVVKGPQGEISRRLHPLIEVVREGNEVKVNPIDNGI